MPRLVAREPFPYGGRNLVTGDEFDAPEEHARVLKALGRVVDAAIVATPSPPLLQTAAMKPEGEELFEEQDTKPKRGRYRRTDMRADE